MLPDGSALIEAAEANGPPHVLDAPLRPLDADSAGVGALVRVALDDGATGILLTVGGSATTDGGTGLLRALGARFLDAAGVELPPGGGALVGLARVDLDRLHPRARAVPWRVAVDVDAPLTGPRGAAAAFAPQKGADASRVARLNAGLARLSRALELATGVTVEGMPGGGAAGGIAASLHAVVGAELVAGAALVAEARGLRAALARADLVVTGEGALDASSLQGKVVGLVAERAGEAGVPVAVIGGRVRLDAAALAAAGIGRAVALDADGADEHTLLREAREQIRAAARLLGEGLGPGA